MDSSDPNAVTAEAILQRRRERLSHLVGRRLEAPPPPDDLEADRRTFLREEAEELYWNEWSWEAVVVEEIGGHREIAEIAFAGFLAFIEGLLVRETPSDSPAPATPRPGVVEEILRFLAARCASLTGRRDPEAVRERALALRLIDLVLYRQHEVAVEVPDRLGVEP